MKSPAAGGAFHLTCRSIITRRDADDVVVMSLSTWNSWKETEYLLASPANARHLREAIARLDAGHKLYKELIEPDRPHRVSEPKANYDVGSKRKKSASPKRGKK